MYSIDLSGKTALITGGTRNIGLAIAHTLAMAGADVALFYRVDEASAMRARQEIHASTGRRVETYRVDVSDERAVESGIEAALSDFGGVFSILVHNATWHGSSAGEMPNIHTAQWRSSLGVNLDAAFFLTRALLSREGAFPKGSSAVFISSGRGHGAAPGMAPYGTAKAALNHFGAMLAQDIGPRGIRVNVVSPGFTDTDHAPPSSKTIVAANTALRRIGTPEDVARAVLFFASDLSAFVTGQCLQVNGGT